MISRAAEWHPLNDRVFASSGGNRVELFEIQNHERNGAILRAFVETQHPISCFQWGVSSTNNPSHQSLPLLALGSSSGNISLADWNRNSEVFVYEAGSRRPCTGVGWSKHRPEQLAAGFEKARNPGEFCVAVFDIEHGGKVVFRPASEEPTASLAWLPHDPHILAVGTSISWIRIYDIRVSSGGGTGTGAVMTLGSAATNVAGGGIGSGTTTVGGSGNTAVTITSTTATATTAATTTTTADIMSILAHPATRPRKVKGIRPDPLQQHIVASYSDSPGEPIKIWDLRKGAAAKPKLMVIQSQVGGLVSVASYLVRISILYLYTYPIRVCILSLYVITMAFSNLPKTLVHLPSHNYPRLSTLIHLPSYIYPHSPTLVHFLM